MTPHDPDHAGTGDARMYRLGKRHGNAVWRDGNPIDLAAKVADYDRKRRRDGALSHFERGMLDALRQRTTGETR